MPGINGRKVTAVTVTWNSAGVVSGLLDSLLADGGISEIIAVDNASTDGTRELIKEKYPAVKLIENSVNTGFAAGVNSGIKRATGSLIFLVNPDISFAPGFVGSLSRALLLDGGMGACAPKLIRPDGTMIDSAGLVMGKNRKARDRGGDRPDDGDFGAPAVIFGACGAAVMFRREALEDAAVDGEYFDESFFAYKEDVDLAWRMDLLGWKTVYAPDALAVHGRGWKAACRSDVPRWIRRHSHKNRYLTIIKNDDAINLLLHLPQILFYEMKLLAYMIFKEPFLFGAWADVIRLLPDALGKRRAIMARRKVSPEDMRGLIG
jgi:GT2 family glycosyltransferase